MSDLGLLALTMEKLNREVMRIDENEIAINTDDPSVFVSVIEDENGLTATLMIGYGDGSHQDDDFKEIHSGSVLFTADNINRMIDKVNKEYACFCEWEEWAYDE